MPQQPKDDIDQEIAGHWILASLEDERRQRFMELARQDPRVPSPLDEKEVDLANFCIEVAATELLATHEAPYYKGSAAGQRAALYAARIRAGINCSPYHPYVQACHHLQTAAMLAVADDRELTESWWRQRNIASSIMAGHLNPTYHAFYRLTHHTVRDLIGLGRKDIPPVKNIAKQIINQLRGAGAPNGQPLEYSKLQYTLGLLLWAETINQHRSHPDHEKTSFGFTEMEMAVNDLYLSPPMYWVRTAYAKINLERSHRQQPPEQDK